MIRMTWSLTVASDIILVHSFDGSLDTWTSVSFILKGFLFFWLFLVFIPLYYLKKQITETFLEPSQQTITCSKLRIKTLEQGVKYVQS